MQSIVLGKGGGVLTDPTGSFHEEFLLHCIQFYFKSKSYNSSLCWTDLLMIWEVWPTNPFFLWISFPFFHFHFSGWIDKTNTFLCHKQKSLWINVTIFQMKSRFWKLSWLRKFWMYHTADSKSNSYPDPKYIYKISAELYDNILLWVVRGQKEDTEEEKVGGTSLLNINRTYIQNKSVSTADRSVCPNCQVWLLVESLSESKIGLVFMKEEEFIIV